VKRTEPAFAGDSDDDFLVHGDKLAERADPRDPHPASARNAHVDVLDVALASKLPALRTIDLSACEIENPYSGTTREAFDATLRRARRDFSVVLPTRLRTE